MSSVRPSHVLTALGTLLCLSLTTCAGSTSTTGTAPSMRSTASLRRRGEH